MKAKYLGVLGLMAVVAVVAGAPNAWSQQVCTQVSSKAQPDKHNGSYRVEVSVNRGLFAAPVKKKRVSPSHYEQLASASWRQIADNESRVAQVFATIKNRGDLRCARDYVLLHGEISQKAKTVLREMQQLGAVCSGHCERQRNLVAVLSVLAQESGSVATGIAECRTVRISHIAEVEVVVETIADLAGSDHYQMERTRGPDGDHDLVKRQIVGEARPK